MTRLALALLIFAAAGCAATPGAHKAPGFDPRVPLRVAVLPFEDRSTGDSLVSRPFTAVLDLVPVLSDDGLTRTNAATLLRLGVAENLHRTSFSLIEPHIVDTVLAHRGVDARKMYATRAAAARAVGEAVGADAVFFGEVLEWDREFYVVEAIARVGLALELRETIGGGVLFRSEVRQDQHAGVSSLPFATDPAGAAQGVFIAALRGLRNGVFATLSHDVGRASILGLIPPAEERAAAKAPRIAFAAHSLRGPVKAGDEVTVVAIGDPGARATFRLDGDEREVPMVEGAPGSYRGSVRAARQHAGAAKTITVRLVGTAQLASTMSIRSR